VQSLPAILLASMFGVVILHFGLQRFILSVLRTRHPNIYSSIPRPMLPARGNDEDNRQFAGFMFRFKFGRHFLRLQDPMLNVLCTLDILLTVGFAILFAATLWAVFRGR
jgi:hypothetical protein